MTKGRIITGTPPHPKTGEPRNLDPLLHGDLDLSGLNAPAFRTLATVLRHGEKTPSIAYLAAKCGVSPDTTKRHLRVLVEHQWLTATPAPRNNSATSYRAAEKLRWGKGLRLFVPAKLDDLGLTPAELRLYYAFVRRANNETGVFLLESHASEARECRLRKISICSLIRHLCRFGLVTKLEGSEAYMLLPDTYWAAPDQLETLRAKDDEPQDDQAERVPNAPPGPKCPPNWSQMPPNGNQVISQVIHVVKHDDFPKIEQTYTDVLSEQFSHFRRFVGSRHPADAEQLLQTWLTTWGRERLAAAWRAAQIPNRRHLAQGEQRGRILTFYDALSGNLKGHDDAPSLCSLAREVQQTTRAARAQREQFAPGDAVLYNGQPHRVAEALDRNWLYLEDCGDMVSVRDVQRVSAASYQAASA